MKKRIFSSLVVVLFTAMALIPSVCLAAGTTTTTAIAKSTRKPHVFSSRDSAGAKPAARFASGINAAAANPYSFLNASYHGGQVMTGVMNVYLIFWEPDGNVSAQYHSLIEQYFNDVGSSPFYQNLKQYTDAMGAFPTGSQLAGTWVDTTSYPVTVNMPANTILDSDIENEVYHAQNANSWPTGDSHTLFFVFLQKDEGLCVDSTLTSCTLNVTSSSNVSAFCAYHTYGLVNTSMLYAAMPYAASPSYRGGCTPTAPHATPAGSRPNGDDADLTLSVVAHEQVEAATDPYFEGWYNPLYGYEIADTCAWTFGPNNAQGADVVWNGHGYILQQIWSNALTSCIVADGYTPRYYSLKNHNSSLVMDVSGGGTSAGTQVIQYANHNGANQQWELVPDGPFFQVVNRKSGLVLDVYQASKSQSAKVVQYTNKQAFNQQWYLVPDGAYDQIVNVNSDLVLDVYKGGTNSGAQVIQYTSHNGANQQWSAAPVAPYYKIVNRNSNLAMDVYKGGTNAGAKVIQYGYKGGLNQQWALVPDGLKNGVQVYQIVNFNSGLVLDVNKGGTNAGAQVLQYTNHHGANQQWILIPEGNYYKIQNVNSNLILDVSGGGKTSGVNVIQWTDHDGLNQQWSLVPTSA